MDKNEERINTKKNQIFGSYSLFDKIVPTKISLSKVCLLPEDLPSKEKMKKNWPLEVRQEYHHDHDHDHHQVKQAGRSFVFFSRSSREKADLLRALTDG